jgi:hypothetical protein
MLMLYFRFSHGSYILAIPRYRHLRNFLGLEGCSIWFQETCIRASLAEVKKRQCVHEETLKKAAEWWDFGGRLRMCNINGDEYVSIYVLGMDIEACLCT